MDGPILARRVLRPRVYRVTRLRPVLPRGRGHNLPALVTYRALSIWGWSEPASHGACASLPARQDDRALTLWERINAWVKDYGVLFWFLGACYLTALIVDPIENRMFVVYRTYR
jgi:hypothetical protein